MLGVFFLNNFFFLLMFLFRIVKFVDNLIRNLKNWQSYPNFPSLRTENCFWCVIYEHFTTLVNFLIKHIYAITHSK